MVISASFKKFVRARGDQGGRLPVLAQCLDARARECDLARHQLRPSH